MSLNKMTDTIIDTTQHRAVKIAGIFFILNLLVPLFNWTLVLNKFNVPENILATASNIKSNELLFRIGITVELFMSVGLIILALVLYKILKPVNITLSLFALLLKFTEATLIAVTVVIPYVALQFLTADTSLTIFTLEQLHFPIGVIFHSHTAITAIPMVFLGLDMMIFSYLFFKSKYIPRIISCFGIISFALIFIHALMFILAPEYATMAINQIIFWTPSGIFEIIIGGWLLIKGIKIQQ